MVFAIVASESTSLLVTKCASSPEQALVLGRICSGSGVLLTHCLQPGQACLTRRRRSTWTLAGTRAREHSVFHETGSALDYALARVGAAAGCHSGLLRCSVNDENMMLKLMLILSFLLALASTECCR